MLSEEPLIPKSKYWKTVDDGVTVISSISINFIFIIVETVAAILVFPLYLIGKLK